jgi:hypothetical protein
LWCPVVEGTASTPADKLKRIFLGIRSLKVVVMPHVYITLVGEVPTVRSTDTDLPIVSADLFKNFRSKTMAFWVLF